MKFPPVSVVPPVLANGQYSYNGVLLGASQVWSVLSADGLDLPKVRNADVDRPLDSGQFEGLDYMSGRDITLSLHSQFASDVALRSGLTAIESVMFPPANAVTEIPIWFQRAGNPLLCCQVRPRQFRLKSEMKLSSIHVAQPIVLLHATSAYVYGPTQAITAQVPGVGSGFAFNQPGGVVSPTTGLGFPLSFGGGGSVGIIDIVNTGLVPARGVYTFTGPIDIPTIANGSLPGAPFMTFNLQMQPGDQLVVDTDIDGPSALYYSAGTPGIGVSVLQDLEGGSTPFLLQVGMNQLVFSSQDSAPTAGECQAMWAPTYPIGL